MRKNRLKGVIALIIMFVSMVGMYLYITLGQEAFTTKSVIVTVSDINKGVVIGYEHFKEKRVRDEDLLAGGLDTSQISSIIGLASKQFIPANSQILSRYFADPGIIVTEDKFVYKIPNNWIYAVPSSIRRTDHVLIYEIDSKIDQETERSLNVKMTQDRSDLTIENQSNDEVLPIYEEEKVTIAETDLRDKEPIIQTTVIYVKDSANREVVDVDGGKRLDASSQVSSIEIVCTKEDISKLEKKVAEGKKLIIVYR